MTEDLVALLNITFGAEFTELEPIEWGRNSQKFALRSEQGYRYFAKVFKENDDRWFQRFSAELNADTLFRSRSQFNIPKIKYYDLRLRVIIYEWIEGVRFVDSRLTLDEFFKEACQLIINLKKISKKTNKKRSSTASNSLLNIYSFTSSIRYRLMRFLELDKDFELISELKLLLDSEVMPLLDAQCSFLKKLIEVGKVDMCLDSKHWILSPSDCGTHNILVNDSICWVDFEYFGWDDPVKLMSDLILHPAMNSNELIINNFLISMRYVFQNEDRFWQRFEFLFPIIALNWALIVLNDFLNFESHFENIYSDQKITQLNEKISSSKKYIDISKAHFDELRL